MNDIISSMSTIKNFMANASRTTCNEYLYSALEDAISSMEMFHSGAKQELEQYRAIGTLDECREAMKRQKEMNL